MSIGQRLFNLLVALNQLVFCMLCLGQSYPNETASAAAWRLEQEGRWAGRLLRPVIDWLFRFDSDHHCREAYDNLLAGKHMPPRIQKGDTSA